MQETSAVFTVVHSSTTSQIGNGYLDLDTRLNADGRDLLHHIGRGVQVDDPLVDAHLEAIVRVGTLTIRGLPRRDTDRLRRQADWARHVELLGPGAADQVR